ncbi:MAG TPA: sulfite exporter TauE/SafE family protein [Blastocatellia bacterium]|nr:sulfite exporter TauE/SafE family protein [Blastocatellia bacterium]
MDTGHTLKLALLSALGSLSAIYVVVWWRIARRQQAGAPSLVQLAIGFVTNFFDTLGIGSFAITTTAYKLLGLVRDENIPGTMVAGHTLPSLAQAVIFLTVINVDPVLLVLMILAMSLGGWLGAGIVARLSRRWIQIGMGVALLVAAWSLLMSQFGLFPAGGEAIGLPVGRMVIAVVMYFVFGALITLGIGHYAPSLVLFSLLGLNVRAAFPIMAGAASFAGPLAAIRFLAKERCDLRAALGLTLGGIPGVLLAACVVKSLPLDVLRWLVVVVIVYTAAMMLRAAFTERRLFTPAVNDRGNYVTDATD